MINASIYTKNFQQKKIGLFKQIFNYLENNSYISILYSEIAGDGLEFIGLLTMTHC